MAKPYEIYGIPEKPWLGCDEPPEYAEPFESEGENDSFDASGIYHTQVRLWGNAEYWTPLEAAILLAGVAPMMAIYMRVPIR